MSGAAVEIWHTDATGDYSAFEDGGTGKDEAEGTTFCRGTQTAGEAGIVEFATIYPGWYPGRTVVPPQKSGTRPRYVASSPSRTDHGLA